ncbi:MAG: Na/Pi cotransporter family protein, partial [Ruminococcus sp.]|nr:Na/Pi cotransporter family protein [Ruminococcus sp.]
TILFLAVFYTLNAIIGFSFLNNAVDEKTVALVHTVFNVSTTIVLLPFSKALEKLAFMVIKDGEQEDDADEKVGDKLKLLDDRFLRTPSVAVEQARMVMSSMAKTTKKSVLKASNLLFDEYDEEKVNDVIALERLVDKYEDGLGTYLVKLSSNEMGHKDAHTVNTLLHSISDLERISDHARHIAKCVKEMHDKEIRLSDNALAELRVMCDAVNTTMDFTITALRDNDLYAAYEVEPLEEVVDQIHTKLKSRHVKRLQTGKCTIELGFIFTDILTALERISDHCSNVAVCMVQVNDDNFETHEYLRTIKTSGAEFDTEVEKFQQQFILPKKEAL